MDFRPHPDANLLSAYLEGGLDGDARRAMVRHFSACAACRQLAASVNTVWQRDSIFLRPENSLPFWKRPERITALATAATVVLAAALWMRAARPPAPAARPAAVVRMDRPALSAGNPNAATRTARPARSHAVLPAPAPTVLAAAAEPPPSLPAVPVPPPSGEIRPSIDFSPLMTGFQDQAPAPGYSAELAAWVEVAPDASTADAPALSLASSAPTSGAPASTATSIFGESLAGASAHPAADLSGPLAPILATGATGLGWTISRSGRLLHSIGAGMWAAVPLVPGLHVHALSTVESRVWAAGRADQLYVSPDRGAHWSQVRLPGAGTHAAPIHSIAFSDAKHGAITADNGATWLTADGGATWKKNQ